MSELERRICQILRRKFGCICYSISLYCATVAELVELVHEACEEEVEGDRGS